MSVEENLLEERKVQALEKISKSLAILVLWFEEVDKEGWSDRIAWYLSLWKEKYIDEVKPSKSKKNA